MSTQQNTSTGYALTSGVLLISAARLGDQIGHRRVFSMGLGLFTLSSAACGVAPDPTVLVLARLIQGAAAALVMPNVLSIIGVRTAGLLLRGIGVSERT